jgi:hypothetical protein
MAENSDTQAKSGAFTPQDLADPAKHQQTQIFERENRPPGTSADEERAAKARFEAGEDMLGSGTPTVGDAAGTDTTGAVAPPAVRSRPGSSSKLGGTPGANAMSSGGRDTDY